jgi:hypothetical protein
MVPLLSALAAVGGVVLTRAALGRLVRGGPPDAHACWALGFVALVPAWLVAFVTLLGSLQGVRPTPVTAAPWVLSVAAALVGAITSEALVRRADESETPPSPARCWRIGLLGGAAAWLVALVGHLARALMR